MNVTFNGTSSVTLTKANGAEVSINGVNIVSVNATSVPTYQDAFTFDPNYAQSVPQTYNPVTGAWGPDYVNEGTQWLVYVHLVDGDYEKLTMGRVANQAGWTNNVAGANAAVAAFEAIMV